MRSKYGMPRAKYGQIKVKYGYSQYNGEDYFMCYGGHLGGRRDVRLLMNALNDRQYNRLDDKYEPSLIDQLESRGYDTRTLTISVEKHSDQLKGDDDE